MLATRGWLMRRNRRRGKVVAQITAAHLSQFAGQLGTAMTRKETIAFLNCGRAWGMWKQRMQAARNTSRIRSSPKRSYGCARMG